MTDHTQKQCPECGQQLRFPKNIGGMLLACPSCGKKFISDFKIGGINKNVPSKAYEAEPRRTSRLPGLITTVFEMPYKILRRIGRFFAP